MDKDDSKAIHDIAVKLVNDLVEASADKDVCAHCVGLEVIYGIAQTIAANMEVEPGEVFNVVHMGLVDGEYERGDAAPESEDFTGGVVH